MFLFKGIGELTLFEVSIIWGVVSFIYQIVKALLLRMQFGGDSSAPSKESDAVLLDLRDTKLGWQWGVFEVEEGKRVRVKLNEDHVFIIGDKGYLKWQGSNLIKFEYGKSMENYQKEKEAEKEKISINLWRCQFCGDTNLRSWEKCGKCGNKKGTAPMIGQEIVDMQPEKQGPICPRCGKICMEGAAFCGNCGTKL